MTTSGELQMTTSGELQMTTSGELQMTTSGELQMTTSGELQMTTSGELEPVRNICFVELPACGPPAADVIGQISPPRPAADLFIVTSAREWAAALGLLLKSMGSRPTQNFAEALRRHSMYFGESHFSSFRAAGRIYRFSG